MVPMSLSPFTGSILCGLSGQRPRRLHPSHGGRDVLNRSTRTTGAFRFRQFIAGGGVRQGLLTDDRREQRPALGGPNVQDAPSARDASVGRSSHRRRRVGDWRPRWQLECVSSFSRCGGNRAPALPLLPGRGEVGLQGSQGHQVDQLAGAQWLRPHHRRGQRALQPRAEGRPGCAVPYHEPDLAFPRLGHHGQAAVGNCHREQINSVRQRSSRNRRPSSWSLPGRA